MKTKLDNTQEIRDLLMRLGIKVTRSVSSGKYILVKGVRAIGTEEEKKEGADYRGVKDMECIEDRLLGHTRLYEDLLDLLEDNLEVSISLRPLNIGQEKLSVDVKLGGKRIASETKIIITNGIGQRGT